MATCSSRPDTAALLLLGLTACSDEEPVEPPPPTCALESVEDPWRALQVAAYNTGAIVRFANGRAACWGFGGECPTKDLPSQPVLANGIECAQHISVSSIGGASVRNDGALLVWGINPVLKQQDYETQSLSWQPVLVPGLPPVTFVNHDGGDNIWALDAEHQVWFWGTFSIWELHQPVPAPFPDLGPFQSLYASGYFCGLRLDGTVSCLGANNFGQLGDGTLESRPDLRAVNVPPAAAYWGNVMGSCVATLDGELWCWGEPANLPRYEMVDPLEGATPLPASVPPIRSGAMGIFAGCAITWDDDLYCWGNNAAISTTNVDWTPRHITAAGKVEQVALGSDFICVVRTDGTVSCGGLVRYVRPDGDDPYRWDIVDFSHLTGGE